MREATIILPYHAIEARKLEADLLHYFGGFTAIPCQGSWVDDTTGTRYDDTGHIYMVAMDDTLPNDARLERIAVEAGALADQLSVYIRFANGDVAIRPCGGHRDQDRP